LRDHEAELRAKGANLAVIGMGDAEYARSFRVQSHIDFPLLIDESRQAYRAMRLKTASILHLLRADNTAARRRAADAGHRQGRLGEHPFQLGGSFVFAPGNVDLWSHLSETFGDNAEIAQILAAIKAPA
jgi:AhpC/TSA antioxidant enzyme